MSTLNTAVVKSNTSKGVKFLLSCGVAVAPLFFAVSIAQFPREGFDIRQHALSTLTLGDLGWLQSLNFILTGLLSLFAALGIRGLIRKQRGGVWAPLLVGLFGLGMMMAGMFRPDPGFGFPVGAPPGMPESMSTMAAIHSFAFFTAFICLIAACWVMASHFSSRGKRRWKRYCILTGIVTPLLIMVGMSLGIWVGVIMGTAGLVAFGWLSVLAASLRKRVATVR
ncbi:DUF998 domain-containing protein [Bacillus horti]|uniref:Membrane protein n=1 Tax=Caldalkalibacillus horti TaxID=77523 RepID=A0ABT9VVF2_9BACI|nr:DUF998 domain-containing protein [Bacillus horti]MDQ0164939.1 putative membrane protein [Bacillus horti]